MSAPAVERLTPPTSADVLAAAATLLERDYSAARLTSVTLCSALRQAALQLLADNGGPMSDIYQLACEASDVMEAHLRGRGESAGQVLSRWSTPHATAEVIADLRAAAGFEQSAVAS